MQGFPNRGCRVYQIPGDLSRPARPSTELVRYQNFHKALLAQESAERLQFLLTRSQTPASPLPPPTVVEDSAPDTTEMGLPTRSAVTAPLVASIKSVPSTVGRSTGIPYPKLRAARPALVPTVVEQPVIDPQHAQTDSFSEVERAISAARTSVSAADTRPSDNATPSRERVRAAAALVADARHAWTTMRGEVQQMLTQMQRELAVEAQSQLATLANKPRET